MALDEKSEDYQSYYKSSWGEYECHFILSNNK